MRRLRRAAPIVALAFAAACTKSKPKTSAELLLNERMAQVLLRDNRPAEAEKAFRECLKDDPKNPEVLDGLGVSLLMQARYKDALGPFDKAVGMAPENGAFRNNRGVALMELGQFKAAQDDFLIAAASQNSEDERRRQPSPRNGPDHDAQVGSGQAVPPAGCRARSGGRDGGQGEAAPREPGAQDAVTAGCGRGARP